MLNRTSRTSDPDDIKPHLKQDRKLFKMEVSIPTMELLQRERRIKQEDYKKLDKMKNVSSLCQLDINIHL